MIAGRLIRAHFSMRFFFFLSAPIVGHVGDGNFHCFIPIKPGDEGELQTVKDFTMRLSR